MKSRSILLTAGAVGCCLLIFKACISSPLKLIGDSKNKKSLSHQVSPINWNFKGNGITRLSSLRYYNTDSLKIANPVNTGITFSPESPFTSALGKYYFPSYYSKNNSRRFTDSNDYLDIQIDQFNSSFIVIEDRLASVLDNVLIDEDAESVAMGTSISPGVVIVTPGGEGIIPVTPVAPIPSPAIVPGLIGMGIAAVRKYRQEN